MNVLAENEIIVYKKLVVDFRKWVKKIKGSDDEADDVLHEAMIKYLERKHRKNLQTKEELGGYIFRIAQNLWYKYLKSQNRLQENKDGIEDDFMEEFHREFPIFEFKEIQFSIIEECLRFLPEKAQDLIKRFYFEGFSMIELAKKFGYSGVDSVKVAKLKYMNKVRDCSKIKLEQR